MSSNNKQIAKNTLMLYFRMILTMGVSLYTSRVVLEVLGVNDFGIYNVVGGVVVMFSFLNSAMSNATQRFFSFELGRKNDEQLKKTFSLSVLIHILIAILVLIVAETVGLWLLNTKLIIPIERLNAANWVYQFSILAFLVTIISVPYNSAIIAHERMSVYAYVGFFEVCLKLFIVFLLQKVDFDKLKLYAGLTLAISLIIRAIDQIYCRKMFKECKFQFIWDKKLFKSMLEFGGWNLFGELSWVFRSQGANIILNIFFGPLVNAARGVAYQIEGAVSGFVENFQTALKPVIVKSYAADDSERVQNLAYQGGRFSYFLLLVLSTPIFFQTEDVLRIWLKGVPDYAVVFTQIAILSTLLNTYSRPLTTIVQATGKQKLYQSIQGGFFLFSLPVMYLVLTLGATPVEAMLILPVFSFLGGILRFILAHHLVPYLSTKKYFKDVLFKITIVSVFSGILGLGVSCLHLSDNNIVSFIIRSVLLVVVTLITVWIIGVNTEERKQVIIFIKTRFKNEKI